MHRLIYFVSSYIYVVWILCWSYCGLDVLWNVNQDRSWLSCACNMECHFYNFSKVFSVPYCYSILCDTACYSNNVDLLKSIISNKIKRYLACKTYKWNIIIMCICKPCDNICCSRPAGYKTYTYFSC